LSLEEEIRLLTSEISALRLQLKIFNSDKILGQRKESSRLIPVTKWNQYHEWPPIGGLRSLIFNAKYNGIGCCVKKVGRRVLIIEDEFFKWAKNHPEVK
jgi:hypothetical protein